MGEVIQQSRDGSVATHIWNNLVMEDPSAPGYKRSCSCKVLNCKLPATEKPLWRTLLGTCDRHIGVMPTEIGGCQVLHKLGHAGMASWKSRSLWGETKQACRSTYRETLEVHEINMDSHNKQSRTGRQINLGPVFLNLTNFKMCRLPFPFWELNSTHLKVVRVEKHCLGPLEDKYGWKLYHHTNYKQPKSRIYHPSYLYVLS